MIRNTKPNPWYAGLLLTLNPDAAPWPVQPLRHIKMNAQVSFIYGLLLCLTYSLLGDVCRAQNTIPADDKIEVQFNIDDLHGNPFDYTANDVKAVFSSPKNGDVSVPAFFDGGTTWRARYRPDKGGHFAFRSVVLNGKTIPLKMGQTEFDVSESKANQFIRIDPKNKMRFAFEDGKPFYPVGYNLAWRSHGPVEMPGLVDSLNQMGNAGVNWTRIWMNYWDEKNLDWPLPSQGPLPIGTLLLRVAQTWDGIVDTAEKNQIHFQMVLQHHGQYSTSTDANWQLNPWNKSNGGWLEKPEDFFTDARAIQLTKNKYRYIVARWGYSPAIMAFELFNEVESTNAVKKNLPSVAAWHQTMADFMRQQDRYHHLITTSSDITRPSLFSATDYYQAHAYPSDLISAIAGLDDQKLQKAYFYGEMGASSSSSAPPAQVLHQILWASLMSSSAGTGEFWNWFDVEPLNLLGQFTSVQKFIAQSGMLVDSGLKPAALEAQAPLRGPLEFGPGRDWAPSATTDYVIDSNGTVEHLGGMSAFLQGTGANHAMFPFANFKVNYPEPGTFGVEIDQVTSDGAQIQASVDGKLAATVVLGCKKKDQPIDAILQVPVSAGSHLIHLENTGKDWAHISQFALNPYSPELAVLGKTSDKSATLWVYRRQQEHNAQTIKGAIKVAGLTGGKYHVVWWSTDAGKIISEADVVVTGSQPMTLSTPAIDQDAACWISQAH